MPTCRERREASWFRNAATYVIATPTPLEDVTGVANLQHVRQAAETVEPALDSGDLVVFESTVPPGTATRVLIPILERNGLEAGEFGYAYSPERALPGNTINEMIHNDRIVGGIDADSCTRTEDLYGFMAGNIHTTDVTTAELVKLIENTYRDVNIALANEIAMITEGYAIDSYEAIELANRHPRVDILSPGPGVGGHCIPIDPQFLDQMTSDHRLVSVAREINDSMPIHVLGLVQGVLDKRDDVRLAVLGAAYKGDVGDTRETPSLRFLRLAENEGYTVRVHDPHVETFEYDIHPLDRAVAGSDCIVILTDHTEYVGLDVDRLADHMRNRKIVDARGIIDPSRWEAANFTIRRLGDGRR